MNGKGNSNKLFWEQSPGDPNGNRVFVNEYNALGISVTGIVTVMKFPRWHQAAELFNSLEYSKMTVLQKIAYWYLFQRKVKV